MRKEWFGICLITFCFVLIYFPALHFPFFIFDDSYHITSRPEVIAPSWQNAINFWATSRTPIIFNIWQLISSAFGVENPQPYRIINYLVHLINLFLVFKITSNILTRFFKDNHKETLDLAACVGVLFFGIHPALVESLVWVSSLRTTLSATFGFLSILFYLKTLDKEEPFFDTTISFLFLVLGTLIKPGIVSLFLVYPFLDLAFFKEPIKKVFAKNIVFLIFVLIVWAIHTSGAKGVGKIDLALHKKVFIIVKSTIFYLKQALLPTQSLFAYSENFESSINKPSGITIADIFSSVAILLGYLLLLVKKRFYIFFVTLTLFILLLFPHLGIVTFDFQQLTLFSDRYLYFPLLSVSLFFAILYLTFDKTNRPWVKKIISGAFFLFAIFLFSRSVQNVSLWKSSSTLLGHSYEQNKDNKDYVTAYINSLFVEKKYNRINEFLAEKDSKLKMLDLVVENQAISNYLAEADEYYNLNEIALNNSPSGDLRMKLRLLRRSNRLLATHKSIYENLLNLSEAEVKKELELLDSQIDRSIADAYATLGDSIVLRPPPKTSQNDVELAALAAYQMALKISKKIDDPVRAQWIQAANQKLSSKKNKKKLKK